MPRKLLIYIASVSVVGLVTIFWDVRVLLQGPTSWAAILLFVAIVIIAEMMGTDLLPGSRATVSISSAVYFASLLIFGPHGGALVAVSSGLAATIMSTLIRSETSPSGETSILQRALFNMSVFGISALVAGGVYQLSGGTVGEISSLSNLLPIFVASLALDLTNAALIVGVVALQTGQNPLDIWNKNFRWAAPINILAMVIGGGGLALGYTRLGLIGVGVFLLPILSTSYSFRLYVERAKAQMARLEEIIAQRTAELRTANEELKRMDQQKTLFYSIINHEMRIPLTSILGYCDLLRIGGEAREQREQLVTTIKDNGRRLLDLVNNLLDISRIEAGRMTVVQEPIAMSDIVQDALRVIQPLADQKHISIQVDVPEALPLVYADRKKASQILINLLSNAVKYTPDTGSVSVRSHPVDGNMLQTDVADTGIGIPPEQLPHIFDQFSRVETAQTRDTVGTGLGLTIVKGLVEAHGGRIWVESKEGEGSCFHFTLPVHKYRQIPQNVL